MVFSVLKQTSRWRRRAGPPLQGSFTTVLEVTLVLELVRPWIPRLRVERHVISLQHSKRLKKKVTQNQCLVPTTGFQSSCLMTLGSTALSPLLWQGFWKDACLESRTKTDTITLFIRNWCYISSQTCSAVCCTVPLFAAFCPPPGKKPPVPPPYPP